MVTSTGGVSLSQICGTSHLKSEIGEFGLGFQQSLWGTKSYVQCKIILAQLKPICLKQAVNSGYFVSFCF